MSRGEVAKWVVGTIAITALTMGATYFLINNARCYYTAKKKRENDDDEEVEEFCPERERFNTASKFFQKLVAESRPDQNTQLLGYGLFKQATVGDVDIPCPSRFIDPVGNAKWEAWSSCKGQTKSEAMAEYTELVLDLLTDDEKEQFSSGKIKGGVGFGTGVSTMQGGDNGDRDGSDVGLFCEAIVANRFDLVQSQFAKDKSLVNGIDKDGMRPLHWAADRGNVEITTFLLDFGADVDAKDEDGNSALHFAVLSEQADVARVLLARGAKYDIKNEDGETARGLARGTELDSLHW
eukprot:gene1053-729_t